MDMPVCVYVRIYNVCVCGWGNVKVDAPHLSSPPSLPYTHTHTHTHRHHHLQVLNGFCSSGHVSPTVAAEVGERPREKSN